VGVQEEKHRGAERKTHKLVSMSKFNGHTLDATNTHIIRVFLPAPPSLLQPPP